MDWTALWQQVLPHIFQIVSLLMAALVAWVGNAARGWLTLRMEAGHRDALHQAILTGVQMGLAQGVTGEDAAETAVAHALVSVPDAISALTKTVKAKTKKEREQAIKGILRRIALGKLGLAGKLLSGG